ncbi:MAG: hypothetical protein KDC33_07210 [Thermoleophilia bacterium]|nr:hypothetical protein [Thermoleophilia bacterium]
MNPTLLDVLVVAAAGAVAVGLGGPLVTFLFRRIDATVPGDPMTDAERALRGGVWIGVLERIAVFAAIVAGWPEGLALVAAIKGLGRYPELKGQHRDVSERFIIGTFASTLWAAGCAGIAIWLNHIT